MSADDAATLRRLPSVDQLVRRLAGEPRLAGLSRARLTGTVRDVGAALGLVARDPETARLKLRLAVKDAYERDRRPFGV